MALPEAWLQAARDRHPLDSRLFGTLGAITAELIASLTPDLVGKQYEFMDMRKFQTLDLPTKGCVYWREMLTRVHWAASLNMMRHLRWQMGCVEAFAPPPNLLSFAANLRGLVEAALDANYSLGPVLYTLAANRKAIESALEGASQNFLLAEAFEDRLIHFIYARRVGKELRDVTPESHTALEPKDYRNAEGLPKGAREGFRNLYDELCALCHPTAYSLTLFWSQVECGDITAVLSSSGNDESRIQVLCSEHSEAISLAMSMSVTASALCLRALNWFSLPEVRCTSIEQWNFDDVPAWKKAVDRLSMGNSNS